MRLVWKLTIALIVAMCGVLALDGYYRIRNDVALIEDDMRIDHHAMGRALKAAVIATWRREGEPKALEVLDSANQQEKQVLIRWIWLDVPSEDAHHPQASPERLRSLATGQTVFVVQDDQGADERLCTYVPASTGTARTGAIELCESLTQRERFIRSTIFRALLTTAGVIGVCAAVALVLGVYFVGRPVRALIESARRVGEGDLSTRLHLTQRDELADLAAEMNAMCERLAEAQEQLRGETAARLATLEQLRHADRLVTVGKLSSGIAHEMGTPLNVIFARARMIASGEAQEEAAIENSEIIVAQTERITKIIRQLLDFARRRSPKKERIDLRPVVRQSLLLMETIAEEQGVSLSLERDSIDATIPVDAEQMHQVLTNLILNGIQASSEGGTVRLRICRVEAAPPADHEGAARPFLRIDVEDEGTGIPPDVVERIFEPFFTTKDIGQGTGLGLSVSHGIVREHGGWIAVESVPGRGSCFSVYLREE